MTKRQMCGLQHATAHDHMRIATASLAYTVSRIILMPLSIIPLCHLRPPLFSSCKGLLQAGIRNPQDRCPGKRNHGAGCGGDWLLHGVHRSGCLRQNNRAREPARGRRALSQPHGLLAAGVCALLNVSLSMLTHLTLSAYFEAWKGNAIGWTVTKRPPRCLCAANAKQ